MFMNTYMFVLLLLSLILVMFSHKYFMMLLISLEYMVVIILSMLLNIENIFGDWLFMYFLVLSVCEAVLGLSILVTLMISNYSQGVMLMNLKC